MTKKPYLTKVWCSKYWRYIYTRKQYSLAVWWKFGRVSYKRLKDDEGL